MCAGVYFHIWQRFARASVPGFSEESVLLSPSTVLIKASGGRQEGWTEREKRRRKSHACMTRWFMWWRERAREGRDRSDGAEARPTEHQTSFHLLASAVTHATQNFFSLCRTQLQNRKYANYYLFKHQTCVSKTSESSKHSPLTELWTLRELEKEKMGQSGLNPSASSASSQDGSPLDLAAGLKSNTASPFHTSCWKPAQY